MTEDTGHRNPNEAADALSAYWDSLVGGPQGNAAAPAGFAATIARLRTSDTTPALLPAQRGRVWEEIIASHAPSAGHQVLPLGEAAHVNGRAPGLAPLQPAWNPRSTRPNFQPRWLLAQLATAALLLVTLGLGYFAFGPHRPSERTIANPVAVVPAAPTAGETTLEPVFATTLPAGTIPATADLYTYVLANATLDADTRVPVQGQIPGTLLASVLEGQLTLRVDGPLQVFRGPDRDAEIIPRNTEAVLDPGDTALYDYALPAEYANLRSTPVRIVQGGFLSGELPGPLSPLAATDFTQQYPVPALAKGPVRTTLTRAVVPPKGETPAQAPDTRVIAVGAEQEVSFGEGSNGALRNVSPKPIAIYVLTLEPAAAESVLPALATPASGEPTIETLLDTTIEAMPVGRANVEVDRWRLRPYATPLTQSALGGTMILLVDTGQITAHAAGNEQHLAAGNQVTLTGGQIGALHRGR